MSRPCACASREPALDGGVRGRGGVLRRRAVGLAAGELLDRGRPDGAVAVGGVREDHRVIGGLRHEPNLRLRRRTGNRSVVQRGAEALERTAQEARDVDLREADVGGDPALAAAAVEPEDDDPALVQRQRAEGGGDRDPVLGAGDRVGERGVVLARSARRAGAGRPGARMTPPRSRRWLRISPVIVGTAKASNAPRPGSKRSTAWISPMQPAWTRSSSGSPPRRAKRSASVRTSGRLASIRRRRSGVSRTCPIGRPTLSPKIASMQQIMAQDWSKVVLHPRRIACSEHHGHDQDAHHRTDAGHRLAGRPRARPDGGPGGRGCAC